MESSRLLRQDRREMTMKLKDYVIVGLMCAITIILSHQANISAKGSFDDVIPIDGPAGAIRLFDRSTGTIYSYDSTMQEVSRVVVLSELGKPAEVLVKPAEADYKYKDTRQEW